jgi:hypothetical protein
MEHKSLTALIVCIAFSISATAYAQSGSGGAGARPDQRPAGTQRDTRSMREQAESRREQAELKRQRAEAKNRSAQARTEHPLNENAADAAFRAGENAESGSSAEMLKRRDERKAIHDEYRDSREPGQEGANPDQDKDDAAEQQKVKAKKSWWKFWGE